jgi:hypothetical protein
MHYTQAPRTQLQIAALRCIKFGEGGPQKAEYDQKAVSGIRIFVTVDKYFGS